MRAEERKFKSIERKLKSDTQKELIRQLIISKQGSRTQDVMSLLNVCRRRASSLLSELNMSGKLFRTGTTYTVRYWSSEAASLRVENTPRELSDAEMQARRSAAKKRMKERSDMPGMVFLCEKRPKSINTVFERCKKNSEQYLMVYRVMAGVK